MCRTTLLSVALGMSLVAPSLAQHTFKPKAGYVPDQRTAVSIAEAVLVPIYGDKVIREKTPLRATLRDGTWIVAGTLPRGYVGGVATIEINKDDGRILRVSHGQ